PQARCPDLPFRTLVRYAVKAPPGAPASSPPARLLRLSRAFQRRPSAGGDLDFRPRCSPRHWGVGASRPGPEAHSVVATPGETRTRPPKPPQRVSNHGPGRVQAHRSPPHRPPRREDLPAWDHPRVPTPERGPRRPDPAHGRPHGTRARAGPPGRGR